LINNRQGGRRRGRGGQQGGGRNLGGQPGNRQDNRQRGNAAQLLEKYKSMARDAQLAGDRVQTEYYLQYADHYFRVLGESRARFEDQRPQRGDDMDEDDGDEDLIEAGQADRSERDERQDRPEREDNRERADHQDRPERQQRPDRGERFNRGDRRPRYSRDDGGADRSDGDQDRSSRVNGADDSLPLDVLPPAIGADAPAPLAVSDGEPAPKPRRRSRGPRPAEGDDEIAPAA
jgi:hypothetical protein